MGNKLDAHNEEPKGVIPLDHLLTNAGGSMFILARIAMLRATEIYGGSQPLVDHLPLDKSTTIAFKEIAAGKVALGNGLPTEEKESMKREDV